MQLFLEDIKIIINDARSSAVRSVNHALTLMYWYIGERIVKEEQHGEERAKYGKYLIKIYLRF